MPKPKCRYNHKKQQWEQVHTVTADITVRSSFCNNDGSRSTFTIPRGTALAEHYLRYQPDRVVL